MLFVRLHMPFLVHTKRLFQIIAALAVFAPLCAFAQELIQSQTPFSVDAKLERSFDPRSSGPQTKETGELNGVLYSFYYADGSGTFVGTRGNSGSYSDPLRSNWDVSCTKDPITDQKMCQMRTRNLWIFVRPKGRVFVSIGAEHFPGSVVTLRIDKGNSVSALASTDGNFGAQASTRLVQQLKRASTVTTRFMRWPNQTWEDDTWELLYGFNEAYSYVVWAVERIR